MPKITLTVGASSSGKTSWIKEQLNLYDVNRDTIRFDTFTDGERDWTKYKFNKHNEKIVTEKQEDLVNYHARVNRDICISDTNLNIKTRNKWKKWAKDNNYEYEEVLFPCDWKTLVTRNSQRQGGLSEKELFRQYKSYMQQFGYYGDHKIEVYKEDKSLDYTTWVDIDGTVADMGKRKPFDWDKVYEDKPRHEIINMVCSAGLSTGHITFMSGRDSCCYEDTRKWIETYIMDSTMEGVSWDLYMRPTNDWRKDDIIKYELYLNHIKGIYNIASIFDDRAQVLRMQDILEFPNVINVGGYQNEF